MLNPGWRTPPTRGGEMGSSQEGTPPHPTLGITPPEGAVLLRSFLHLALRGHPPPTQDRRRLEAPTGWERGRLWTEAEKAGETPGSDAASQSLPPGGPRGQSKDWNPGEREASFLGRHSGPEGTSEPLLLRWGTPAGEERTAPRACMEPTTPTFLECPVAGPWSGCCGRGHCPPGGRGWGFGRREGVALEACSGKRD